MDQRRPMHVTSLESWRPRRDVNPFYRRESTRPSRLDKNLEGAGGAVRPLKLRRKNLSLHDCYMIAIYSLQVQSILGNRGAGPALSRSQSTCHEPRVEPTSSSAGIAGRHHVRNYLMTPPEQNPAVCLTRDAGPVIAS